MAKPRYQLPWWVLFTGCHWELNDLSLQGGSLALWVHGDEGLIHAR